MKLQNIQFEIPIYIKEWGTRFDKQIEQILIDPVDTSFLEDIASITKPTISKLHARHSKEYIIDSAKECSTALANTLPFLSFNNVHEFQTHTTKEKNEIWKHYLERYQEGPQFLSSLVEDGLNCVGQSLCTLQTLDNKWFLVNYLFPYDRKVGVHGRIAKK